MNQIKKFVFLRYLPFILLIFIFVIYFLDYKKFTLDTVKNELDFSRLLFKLKEEEPKSLKINLSISDYSNLMSQIEFFIEKGFIKDEYNYWRKAELTDNDDQYQIKYKLNGTSVTQLRKGYFNFRIKFKKDEKYLDNERQFNLLKIFSESDETISTIIINNLAKDVGLLSPEGKSILVKINNVNHGLFYKQVRHSKEWFEKEKITNYSILKNNDDWDKKNSGHNSDLDLNEKNIEISGSSSNPEIALGSLKKLFSSIKSDNLEGILKLIDLEYFAKFLALLTLVNDSHMITGDNLKYIYDHTLGNFKILFRHESSINYTISTDVKDFNKALFINNKDEVLTHKLFKILLTDNNFRKKRDKYLNIILKQKQQIIENANNIYDQAYKNIMFSNLDLNIQKDKKEIFFYALNTNFNKISEYLNYSKIYVSTEKKNEFIELSLVSDAFVPIRLKSITFKKDNISSENIKIEYENSKKFLLYPITFNQKNSYHNQKKIFINSNLKIDSIEFENLITKKNINPDHIYINKIFNYKLANQASLLDSLNKNKINFKFTDNNLLIKKGDYKIINNIIVPVDIQTKIEKGTIFNMSKNISILFQGNLNAKGSKEEKILVNAINTNEPFGTFAVVGKNYKSNVNLSNFIIEGGSEASLAGMVFLGQLSLHNSNVSIIDSKISKSYSDDGANIRNSNIDILNTSFSFNKFDQLDLDFCNGSLINNKFIINSNQPNESNGGDGIDLSGSNILISNNQIKNLTDKGISVGEKSKALISENEFIKNNIAIAIKDESQIYDVNNNFIDNTLNFSLYVKKKFFKEPILYLNDPNQSKKITTQDFEILDGKIILIEQSNKLKFYNEFKNEIIASRI